MYLVQAESSSTISHYVLNTTLVHRYHIGLSLDHVHPIFACNSLFGLPNTV